MTECAASEREPFAGGRPCITVSQCLVSAWKRRMWRRERAAVRSSQAEGLSAAWVVVAVVLVPGVEVGFVSVCFEIAAVAAAVVRPRNASRSPQAKIERRNLFPP